MNITMPPLRKRDDDVLLLAEHFLKKYADHYQKDVSGISADAKKILVKYHWPGNIRELENLIHREVLLATDDEINIHFDGVEIYDNTAYKDEQYSVNSLDVSIDQEFNQSKAMMIEKFEKEYLERLLENTHGNVTLAAKRAGKERRCLGKLIKKTWFRQEQVSHAIVAQTVNPDYKLVTFQAMRRCAASAQEA